MKSKKYVFKLHWLISIVAIFLIVNTSGQTSAKKKVVKKPIHPTTVKPATTAANTAAKKTATTSDPKKPTSVNTNASNKTAAPNLPETLPTPTKREQEMISEINSLRSNPPSYINYVLEYLKKNDVDKKTKTAATELVIQLKKTPPLPPLTVNPVMYNDAKKYGMEMSNNNYFSHSNLPYAENLSLGYENIREAIIDLLIDDDQEDRGHRKNLLNNQAKYIAVVELPGKIQDMPYCYLQEFK